MSNLLTTKQLQALLQIDRTTVYRMLKDGRLTGVKVGNQWRFPHQEVEALLAGTPLNDSIDAPQNDTPVPSTTTVPIHCVQVIQDVFAEIAGIGSVTTAPNGEPITNISNSCCFCNLILNSESGRQACIGSWRKLAAQSENRPKFVACHAGLQYARARIEVNDRLEGLLIAGQFYADPPDKAEEQRCIQKLAALHNLEVEALNAAAQALPVLDDRKRDRIGNWLENVAQTFEQIGHERADLMSRLRYIAEMSRLDPL